MTRERYAYLRPYINNPEEGPRNIFLPLKEEEIIKAEKRLNIVFPQQLRHFYQEIGYGFLVRHPNPSKDYVFSGANRINPPDLIADIIEKGQESGYISQGTHELLTPGDLPFFEISDSSRFLMMKLHSNNPNAVWALGDIKIEDSFERFIWRLYHESPWFYDDVIDVFYGRT